MSASNISNTMVDLVVSIDMFLAILESGNIYLKQSTILSLDLRECPNETLLNAQTTSLTIV